MHLYNTYVTFLEAIFCSLIFRVFYKGYLDPFPGSRQIEWPHHDESCKEVYGCTVDHRKTYDCWVNIVQIFAFVISFVCIYFYKSM